MNLPFVLESQGSLVALLGLVGSLLVGCGGADSTMATSPAGEQPASVQITETASALSVRSMLSAPSTNNSDNASRAQAAAIRGGAGDASVVETRIVQYTLAVTGSDGANLLRGALALHSESEDGGAVALEGRVVPSAAAAAPNVAALVAFDDTKAALRAALRTAVEAARAAYGSALNNGSDPSAARATFRATVAQAVNGYRNSVATAAAKAGVTQASRSGGAGDSAATSFKIAGTLVGDKLNLALARRGQGRLALTGTIAQTALGTTDLSGDASGTLNGQPITGTWRASLATPADPPVSPAPTVVDPAPAPVTTPAAPVPVPVTPVPVIPALATPVPVAPTPVTPILVTPAPVTPAPVIPTPVTPTPAPTSAGGTPTPASIAGLPVVGAIVARSGQVIENVHVTTANGSCITVPAGVSDVTIRNSEIGPCGVNGDVNTYGVWLKAGATRVTIQRNVIHDVSTGVFGEGAMHPIVMDRNFVTNIRGPFHRGQMVQFDGVSSGTSGTKITCNVSDVQGAAYNFVEDHISMYNSPGLPNDRTEIAYNRIRGGKSQTGSGMMIGDGPNGGGNVWAHDNTIVNIGNAGMGIAGGRNITFENNRIFNDGKTSLSGTGFMLNNYSGQACEGNLLKGNRAFSNDVAWGPGNQNPIWNPGTCGITLQGNVLPDLSLNAAMFEEVAAACR